MKDKESHHETLSILEVQNKKLNQAFLQLPWDLLKNESHWVPQLKITLKDILNPKHPFYSTTQMKKWVVVKDGKIVGRIAAMINKAHNDFHEEKCGFFGFFDCIDDKQVAKKLLTTAEAYLRNLGMLLIRGPVNPSTNYECGLLVDGYNDPPQLMMPFNPPYYQNLLEEAGHTKAMDLLAFKLSTRAQIPERIVKISQKIADSHNITWRTMKKSRWKEEMSLMQEIYNEAWERNWGHVPMTPEEFSHLATNLKSICVEELTLIVEVKGRPAGFIVALPDYNQIFKRIPSGNLFPLGIFKLLTGSRKITRARIITLGIRREYRPLGLSTFLYTQLQQQFLKLKQYQEAEMSWVLETNLHMIKPLILMGAEKYKTYRLYEKNL